MRGSALGKNRSASTDVWSKRATRSESILEISAGVVNGDAGLGSISYFFVPCLRVRSCGTTAGSLLVGTRLWRQHRTGSDRIHARQHALYSSAAAGNSLQPSEHIPSSQVPA